jgi:hypothetical protein
MWNKDQYLSPANIRYKKDRGANVKYVFFVSLFFCALCLQGCFDSNDNKKTKSKYTLVSGWGIQEVATVPFDSLTVIDPFILADEATRTYYMTGSGGILWKSTDLQNWKGPFGYIEIDTTSWMGSNPMIWAPELHYYKGNYYCITTFTNTDIVVDTVPERCDVLRRGTHILIADRAEGPYRPMNDNLYLQEDWSTLDGTLWEEDGIPYLVYNHDWMQLVDGAIKYVPLTADLSGTTGESVLLFSASDAPWPREMQSIGELTFGMSLGGYVSDGPFLFRTGTGRLGMLWSSWSSHRYAQGVAYSATGRLAGPWIQQEEPLLDQNTGHGMLFQTFEGKTLLSLHSQSLEENPGPRKPVLLEVDLSGDFLKIIGRYNP